MPKILNLYIVKKFLKIFCSFTLGLIFTISISNLVNNIKSSAFDSFTNNQLILQFIYDVLYFFQLTLPFLILITSLFFIRSLNNTNELDIIKNNGLSMWYIIRKLAPIIFIIGCITIFIISPISSYLKMATITLQKNTTETIATTEDSFWIIDKDTTSQLIIKSKQAKILDDIIYLTNIIVFQIVQGKFNLRVDGEKAIIKEGNLIITNASIKDNSHMFPHTLDKFTLKTSLKAKNIKNVVLEPELIKIWELPFFIKNLHNLGLSTSLYKVYFYNLLAYPFILFAMFILGIGLALSRAKRISSTKIISVGIIWGFSLHFFIDLISAFGAFGIIPPLLTIIGEVSLITCLGIYLVLNKEGL